MLPLEVENLKVQLLGGELSLEDFFCLINTMFELDEAKSMLDKVLEDLEKDIANNVWRTDIKLVSTQLKRMCEELYGCSASIGN